MMRALPAIAAFCLASISAAQDRPFVKVDVSPAEISIGEPVRLRVTVLGPTWFPQPPVFPTFELANAVVRLPPNSSRAMSERVGRESWAGIVRNYEIYPLVAATYRLDDLTMRVTYADPGRGPITVDVDVPQIEFRAIVPAGAEELDPYLAGRALTLTRDITGNPASLEIGDALVVTYTAELDGLPAIFLPPLTADLQIDGVSIYADEPVVEDGNPARRTERLTLVFESGGEFEIPAASLDWWNTRTSAIETATTPALMVSVDGPPVSARPAEEAPAERNGWFIFGGALLILVGLRFIVRAASSMRPRWLAYRQRRRASEAYAFDQLRKALRSGDPHAVYRALLCWLDKNDRASGVREFAKRYDDALLRQIEGLSSALYTRSDEAVDLRHLERSLASARRAWRRAARGRERVLLPPLNP